MCHPGGGVVFGARAALSACVGRLAFLMRVCLRWLPALASGCLFMPHHHVLVSTEQQPDSRKPRKAHTQMQTQPNSTSAMSSLAPRQICVLSLIAQRQPSKKRSSRSDRKPDHMWVQPLIRYVKLHVLEEGGVLQQVQLGNLVGCVGTPHHSLSHTC